MFPQCLTILGRENDSRSLLDIHVEQSGGQLDELVWSLKERFELGEVWVSGAQMILREGDARSAVSKMIAA